MEVIPINKLARNWKLILAVIVLIVDAIGSWILLLVTAPLENSGPVNVVPGHIGPGPSPQPLYYVGIALETVFVGAGILLLVYILTVLEKKVAVLKRFFLPKSTSDSKDTARTSD